MPKPNPPSYKRPELRTLDQFFMQQRLRVEGKLKASEERVHRKLKSIGQDAKSRYQLSLESDEEYTGGRGHAAGPKKPEQDQLMERRMR